MQKKQNERYTKSHRCQGLTWFWLRLDQKLVVFEFHPKPSVLWQELLSQTGNIDIHLILYADAD